jgi:hypothetical protein
MINLFFAYRFLKTPSELTFGQTLKVPEVLSRRISSRVSQKNPLEDSLKNFFPTFNAELRLGFEECL